MLFGIFSLLGEGGCEGKWLRINMLWENFLSFFLSHIGENKKVLSIFATKYMLLI